MSSELKLLVYIGIIVLQFYIGAIAFLYPDKLHGGHYLVVLTVSIPMIIQYIKKNSN